MLIYIYTESRWSRARVKCGVSRPDNNDTRSSGPWARTFTPKDMPLRVCTRFAPSFSFLSFLCNARHSLLFSFFSLEEVRGEGREDRKRKRKLISYPSRSIRVLPSLRCDWTTNNACACVLLRIVNLRRLQPFRERIWEWSKRRLGERI